MRWKTQVNENAKAPAFANTHPELGHNEICGWGQHGDVTRQVFTLVHFRHDYEHPQVMRRFDLTRDLLDEVVNGVEEVEAEGEGTLAQLFDLILHGDFVSLHLAVERHRPRAHPRPRGAQARARRVAARSGALSVVPPGCTGWRLMRPSPPTETDARFWRALREDPT